jgi:DNA-binding response OmpR family regulator
MNPECNGVTKRAVIVDDDIQIVALLKLVLKQRDYDVVTFVDEAAFAPGGEWVCRCDEGLQCSDILLMDLNLRRRSGLDLLGELREHGCAIPFVALMTGAWTDEKRERARDMGCETFAKPFALNDVETWLEGCEQALDPGRQLAPIPV